MKYVVAVSGGVDSVVLLDMLAQKGEQELVVAHFDHGIRPESASDARFVELLAQKYGLPFEATREELGESASEETARNRRYNFLHKVAEEHQGTIATAHHKDDAIETIAINLHRGTGWRGVAVLANPDIHRPLLSRTKAEVYEYALKQGLEWVEDETNAKDTYLRNRIRRKIYNDLNSTATQQLHELRARQLGLRKQIEQDVKTILDNGVSKSRYFFIAIDTESATELLREVLEAQNVYLTRPQRMRLLHAIKTMPAGAMFEAGNGAVVQFTLREFVVNTP